MIGVSGIRYQEELERLPYFNKQTAEILIGKSGLNLDRKLERLVKGKYLVRLKKGLYVTRIYLISQANRLAYGEYLANVLRYPSYLSLEYILSVNNLIPEAVKSFTSITIKSPRQYSNSLGSFIYRNIKTVLFAGFFRKRSGLFNIKTASLAKALFDYLYLKRNLGKDLKYELEEGLRLNWENFSLKDLKEFKKYVLLSKSVKMKRILKITEEIKK